MKRAFYILLVPLAISTVQGAALNTNSSKGPLVSFSTYTDNAYCRVDLRSNEQEFVTADVTDANGLLQQGLFVVNRQGNLLSADRFNFQTAYLEGHCTLFSQQGLLVIGARGIVGGMYQEENKEEEPLLPAYEENELREERIADVMRVLRCNRATAILIVEQQDTIEQQQADIQMSQNEMREAINELKMNHQGELENLRNKHAGRKAKLKRTKRIAIVSGAATGAAVGAAGTALAVGSAKAAAVSAVAAQAGVAASAISTTTSLTTSGIAVTATAAETGIVATEVVAASAAVPVVGLAVLGAVAVGGIIYLCCRDDD